MGGGGLLSPVVVEGSIPVQEPVLRQELPVLGGRLDWQRGVRQAGQLGGHGGLLGGPPAVGIRTRRSCIAKY